MATSSDAGLMSPDDRNKLDALVLDANNYIHPSYDGDDFTVDSGPLTGTTIVSDIDINLTSDLTGHVVDANATISTRELTPTDLGVPATNISGITGADQVTNIVSLTQAEYDAIPTTHVSTLYVIKG